LVECLHHTVFYTAWEVLTFSLPPCWDLPVYLIAMKEFYSIFAHFLTNLKALWYWFYSHIISKIRNQNTIYRINDISINFVFSCKQLA
jgi:hypothetical protein